MNDFNYETPAKSWYLVQVKPNSYKKAELNLIRQGFLVFSPTIKETIKRSGRFISIVRPLFNGYLFVGFDLKNMHWQAINNTYGVARLVILGSDEPKAISEDIISGLQSRCDDKGMLMPPQMLGCGNRVRIVNGPFADFVAKIENISSEQRVFLLLDILGNSTKVAVPIGNLQKI